MLKEYIQKVSEGIHLSKDETARAFQIIMNDGATPAQIAALLMALRINGETMEEIAGAALSMRVKMQHVSAPENAIDVCGTGGDSARSGGTYNVSTAVALVVAACGVPVAKHGNKSVSSLSGSADVLAALGVNIKATKDIVEKSLIEAGICFMYAPLFHKGMRHISPTRQEMGIRTIFNITGPLANPAQPRYQLLGVYDKALLQPMAEVLRMLGSDRAWVVHGEDGMDELTITGISYIAELKDNEINTFEITPEEAGLERAEPDALRGRDPDSNARELNLLLSGKHSPYRDVVLLNAGAALVIAGKAENIKNGVHMAAETIDSGRAKETLANLVRITNAQD